MSELDKKVEAIIFYKGEELKFSEISKILKISEDEVKNSVLNIKECRNQKSGIRVITTEDSVLMTTGEEVSEIIEEIEEIVEVTISVPVEESVTSTSTITQTATATRVQ